MNLWNLDPVFKNYCSMYRESIESERAPNEESMLHHVTSAVYFSIACIEAFLNLLKIEELRALKTPEQEILLAIKNFKFSQKLQNWPSEAIGGSSSIKFPNGIMRNINLFYDVRCGLIHPKLTQIDEYKTLANLSGLKIIEVTATFLSEVWAKKGTSFPYWLLGWNYVNPRGNSQEIIKLSNNQFLYSLNALDIQAPTLLPCSDTWIKQNMKGIKCWNILHETLRDKTYCEKQVSEDIFFSMRPRLCKEWWVSKHVEACGTPVKSNLAKRLNRTSKLFNIFIKKERGQK